MNLRKFTLRSQNLHIRYIEKTNSKSHFGYNAAVTNCFCSKQTVIRIVCLSRSPVVMCRLTSMIVALPGHYHVSSEPRHDKTNRVTVRPAKTQISLGIRPVWSESSLCAQWVAKDPSFLHADSEDSDQTGRMPRLIWVFAGRTGILLVLSSRGLSVNALQHHKPLHSFCCFNPW